MSTSRNPSPVRHLDYLDGIRALAAGWIVVHHCWFTVQGHLQSPTARMVQFFGNGRLAVDLFMVVSGFCLTLPLIRADRLELNILQFLKRRAIRILPPYYCALLVSLTLIAFWIGRPTGTHWDESLPVTGKSIITHVLMVQDAFEREMYKINGPFWSISVEWRVYFFFPLLVLAWRWWGPLGSVATGVVLSFVMANLCKQFLGETLTFAYLGLFSLGVLASGVAFGRGPLLNKLRELPWTVLTCILLFFMIISVSNNQLSLFLRDYIAGLCAMSAIIMTSINPDAWHRRALSWKPLVFVGTFSYSIYLIHQPLVQILWQYVFVPLQSHPARMLATLILAGIPMILGVCYLFFLAFERPFLRRGRSAKNEMVEITPLSRKVHALK